MEKKKEETTDLQKKEKEKRIKKEIARLRKNWHEKGKQIDEVTKKMLDFAEPLIKNLAFMTVTMADLKDQINEEGCVVEYKNGENQYGTKKSPAVETYNAMFKNYTAAYKTLADMIPKPEEYEKRDDEVDEFDAFLSERDS
ncbi:MAG: hypothetical protein MR440_03565 [Firmicutes bacterium]|nr:hypothetical protein [Bacillota bacterium]